FFQLKSLLQRSLLVCDRCGSHWPMISNPDTTTIGVRYHLLDPLGAGSMGHVYRALDRLTGRHVAIKKVVAISGSDSTIIPPPEDLRLALTHEFQALASLRHPYIVTVLDYGFDSDKLPYFVMELLPNARTIRDAATGQALTGKVALLMQM